MAKKTQIDFEQALAELERIVDELERGDQPLEKSLRSFERGIALTRLCQQALAAAEQKVSQLVGDGDGETLVPLDPPDDD